MAPKEYAALCDGFEIERARRSKEMRLATFFTISPHADKSFSFDKFRSMWPIEGDISSAISSMEMTDDEFNDLLNLQKK